MMLYGRILKVDAERSSVDLTTRTSDLNPSEDSEFYPVRDECYDYDTEKREREKEEEKKKQKVKKKQGTRNFSFDELVLSIFTRRFLAFGVKNLSGVSLLQSWSVRNCLCVWNCTPLGIAFLLVKFCQGLIFTRASLNGGNGARLTFHLEAWFCVGAWMRVIRRVSAPFARRTIHGVSLPFIQARQTYVKRVIVHPSFHNVDFRTSEKLLNSMEQGDVVIRPSSKVRGRVAVGCSAFVKNHL